MTRRNGIDKSTSFPTFFQRDVMSDPYLPGTPIYLVPSYLLPVTSFNNPSEMAVIVVRLRSNAGENQRGA